MYRQLNCVGTDNSHKEFDEESIRQFWEQLWSRNVHHNKDAEWLLSLKQHLQNQFVHKLNSQSNLHLYPKQLRSLLIGKHRVVMLSVPFG